MMLDHNIIWLQVNLVIPDDSEKDGCHVFSTNYSHSAVLINSANCSVEDKLQSAQLAGVQLLLISGSLVMSLYYNMVLL